jgi:FkbM family methyltransferase
MGIKKRAFDFIANSVIKATCFNKATNISCSFAELFSPTMRVKRNGKQYLFSCPSLFTKWRADTFFTKEPETIEWIDGFREGEILFDIGANIGQYSIYAAKRGIKVLAFEPESQNYALLNKNIFLNCLEDKVMCLNVALSSRDSLDYIYIPTFQAGGAMNCFGATKDWNCQDFNPEFKQGVISYSLDSFIERYSGYFPAHIKIDVDGIEPEIVAGAEKTLRDQRLKSVLIEINEGLSQYLELIDTMRSYGFSLLPKKHSSITENSPYSKCFNYIFVRK